MRRHSDIVVCSVINGNIYTARAADFLLSTVQEMLTRAKLAYRKETYRKDLDELITFFRFMLLRYFCNEAFKEGILAETVPLQF